MFKDLHLAEWLTLSLVLVITAVGFSVSYLDHDWFKNSFVVEDGFVEWMTVVGLVIGMFVCFRRVWMLRHARPWLFLGMTTLLGLFFFFGAGEEISWGQRILGIESSEFFVENNAQGEMNLHNTVVNGVKINKLVFGRGLAIMMLLYLAVAIPMYHKMPKVRDLADRFAIPIATNYQIAMYLFVIIVIQVLMDSSKKGEMLEFSGVYVFLLNVVFPYNKHLFQDPANEKRFYD